MSSSLGKSKFYATKSKILGEEIAIEVKEVDLNGKAEPSEYYSGIEEDEDEIDIFQDAKDHFESLKREEELKTPVKLLDKDLIFKDSPDLLGVEEYQIVVAKCIANGLSWNESASIMFKSSKHPQIEKTVRQQYFMGLSEEVEHQMSELITKLCCNREKEFKELIDKYEKPEFCSDLWEKIIDLVEKMNHSLLLDLSRKQLSNLKAENADNDKKLQKLQKKIVGRWLQLINSLVPHFFDASVERELLSCIFNWFTCGKMSHSQFESWRKLFKNGHETNLNELKRASWEDNSHAREHVSLFLSLLDDVPTNELTRIVEFKQLLSPFLCDPILQLVDAKSRLKIISKGLFLSDVLKEILEQKTESVKEVNIFAKYFCGIDCNLENREWHGINFTIVTDKLTIWKECIIDVSGTGYSRKVRGSASNGCTSGRNGDDGENGRAGESSGNVVIMTNQLRNPKLLMIKLNGGSGEGGQNGGDGADGANGISIDNPSFLNTILSYNSLYRDRWSNFTDYQPGTGWKMDTDDTVYVQYQEWINRTDTNVDGRQMIYTFAGDCGWTYNSYDIMFLIKGTDGTMGGFGGENGVSGEGGNIGDFEVRSLKTKAEIKSIGYEKKKGEDGEEGAPGIPGNPGKNGNHMAMTDRSSGSLSWSQRKSQKFHGDKGKERLQIVYQYNETSCNALNGLRKHKEKVTDYYSAFQSSAVPTISRSSTTEKRTSSERTSRSQAVSKQTISIDTLLEEFAEICEGDELNIGDFSEFKDFEADENEEEEELEQVQEEISVVRTLVEDSQEHEKNLRRSFIKSGEVLKEIQNAITKLETGLTLVELIDLWRKIFTVPLALDELESEFMALIDFLCNKKFIKESFEGIERLPNGMSKHEFSTFVDTVKTNFAEKQTLSYLKMKLDVTATGSTELNMSNDELTDVVAIPLDSFWTEVNAEKYKTEIIEALFNQIGDYYLSSSALVAAIYKINVYLKDKASVFTPFKCGDNFNWADIPVVRKYFESFLNEEEKKNEQNKREKEIKEAEEKRIKNAKKADGEKNRRLKKEKKDKQNASNNGKEMPKVNSPEESDIDEADEAQESQGQIFTENNTTTWDLFTSYVFSNEVKAFKPVSQQFKEKKTEKVFSDLVALLKDDRKLAERFSITKTVYGSLNQPGSSPQSLIHMYYLTEQILEYNIRLLRYYLPYENDVTISNDWYDPSKEVSMQTVDDLLRWSVDHEMPAINSQMKNFMQMNGIRCRSYRQMIADQRQVNIQVFSESGYCKMRLVENLNSDFIETQRFIITGGHQKTIGINETLRKLRAVMNTCKLNIPLPQNNGSLQLSPYFPESFEPKVQEWTNAAIVATGNEMLPRFFQRLFELRGNSMSVVDFQFIVNTLIEANRTFDVSLESLCNRILAKDGCFLDIFLALRVLGSMKGTAPKLDPLVHQLSEIKEPRLKALFGSKLHEITITEDILTKLVNMLAHADDRVAQLEKMHLQEWVNIANCQRWNSYAPLLKAYGTVGYYIVLLDSIGKQEGQKLEKIINKIKTNNSTCIVLEKVISTLTFLISNNEVDFDKDYEEALFRLLQMISQKCVKMDSEEIYAPELGLRKEDVKVKAGDYIQTENIYLLTNEIQQSIISDMINDSMKEELIAVLPRDNRKLDDLIKLSTNPQDTPEAAEFRQKEMLLVRDILSNKVVNKLGEKLKIIDTEVHNIYGHNLREAQKIAILSAAISKKNLLSQVNTGEGKSFIISCLAILRILLNPNETVDIITSSSVLAQRDAESMKKLYAAFNIEVGHNCDEDVEKRKVAYKCGVVYGDIARFERDYLLQTFYKKNILGDRSRCNVIVDEVDSMLLDNGSNMLYLSHNVPGLELLDSLFVYLHKQVNTPSLNEIDAGFSSKSLRQKILGDMCGLITKENVRELVFDQNNSTLIGNAIWRILISRRVIDSEGILQENWDNGKLAASLTAECGVGLAGNVFAMLKIVKNRRQEIGVPSYLKQFVITHLDEFIKNAKQGLFLKHNDEYVVDLDRTGRATDLHPCITIIDKGTGTDLSTSQWSEGLHQFLQLKHGCRLTPLSLKAVFISNVSYLRGYVRLNGFSGTLGSVEESKSLVELYNADLIKIPTWKPKMFNENAPILSQTKDDWIQDIFDEVCDQLIANRSVLVICQSISKVEELNIEFKKLYQKIKSPDPKLTQAFDNVTVYTREFDDVDFSAEEKLPCCRVIISTNLAGRGTDIALCEDLAKSGGLHVIVSFLPENSRIENQAYGRAARSGQKGSGQIICLVQEEDNGANNIFQLKQFRDNAEVLRLQSLKQFYDYHIAVEETCLKLFKDHCNLVMECVHSDSDELTIIQVIYFALLDQWANWLDSKAEDIRQCERNKDDLLKDHIIGSVKEFLNAHPLPKNDNYAKSLSWIDCPQPILSIALIHLQADQINDAIKRLDDVIKRFPDFEAEAYYYKGIIDQWVIREALEIQPPPKKDEGGNWIQEEPEIRLKISNWLFKNLIFSDDCPDHLIQKCTQKIQSSTEYFLLSRSLFVTRIKKKNEMTHIVKICQQNSTLVASRGFAAQQEESIAVLECFIGSIDDILGHRVKPEDVKLGDENPHLTIRRFRHIMKKADIITPPQLANKISDQQINMLVNNHCLPMTVLRHGFEQIYKNNSIGVYDGQKVIQAEDLAETFPLPSLRGFWKSLKRAGCFLSEQVFIAIKKSDKEKVPVMAGIQPTRFNLTALHVQLSTENLDEYNLYDVHGQAESIRQNDSKNAELHEAQEAGFVHLEVVATINVLALTLCQYLDQFCYLTVNEAAVELGISLTEAEWILDTLITKGILKKTLVEVNHEPTPEEVASKNMMMKKNKKDLGEVNGKNEQENGEEKKVSGHKKEEQEGDISSSEDSGIEEEEKKKEIVYFPIARISCDMFPSNMRSSIQLMLTRHFSYHYALMSLKSSIKKAVERENISHQICLPTNPYSDLCQDLQSLGIVHHSRVTSVLTEVYNPDLEDGVIVKCAKKIFGKKIKIHTLPAVIYKRLAAKTPKLCTKKCSLVATSSYLEVKKVPASSEIRKIVSNGLRKVAIVHEKNWWKWCFGTFLPIAAIAIPILRFAAFFFPAALIAIAVIAAVGTMLYCISLFTENQKIASTLNLQHEEEFRMLRTYHSNVLDAPKRTKANEIQRKQLEQVASDFIQNLIISLEKSTFVTSSDEDIFLWVDALEHCANESTHLPLLQQSLESWFKSNSRNLQEAQFDAIFNGKDSKNLDKTLPKISPIQFLPFAFSSILISEVNARKKTRGNRSKKAISTRLDIDCLPIQSDPTEPTENACPLSFALSKILKKILTPMIEENIVAIIDPVLCGIDIAWRKSREDKIEAIKQDEESLKKRQLQHSAERLAKEQTVDFLATDLHNIFQRILFREESKSMLQHMVKYNYPVSSHCAKVIFDASVTILQSIINVLKQVDIELKRNDQTIFTYNGLKKGCEKKTPKPLIIGLQSDSFYILEIKEFAKNHQKYNHGLFQALCEYSTKFSDNFSMDSQSFVDKLIETIDFNPLDNRWASSISWKSNEKLKCAVAIW